MKNKKGKANNKKIKILIVSILVILLVSSFSYAYYIYSVTQASEHIGSTKCFKLSFIEKNDIELTDALPLTDEEAQELVPYTFTIENICDLASSYHVTLEELNNSDMNPLGIKYQINNSTPLVLGSIVPNQNVILPNTKSSRTLASGILIAGETITYNLRIWIDSNSTVEQTAGKYFESKVVIISNWEKNPYNRVIVDLLSGDEAQEVQVVKGRAISTIDTPSRTGYIFDGWYSDSQFTNELSRDYIPQDEEYIYAKWVRLDSSMLTYSNSQETSCKTVKCAINELYDNY